MSKYFLLLFFLLCGCSRDKQWNQSAIKTGGQSGNHERLVYEVKNPFREVEIELARIDQMTTVFLNVHESHIPPHDGNPKKAAIHLKTHTREITLIADRLEGGQRLKLPPLASKHLIEVLCTSEHVTLSIDPHFETNLDTLPFKEKYKEYKRGAK